MPANPFDSAYCLRLAHAAVHAAMAGRTEVIVARRRRRFVPMPMPLAVSRRNHVDPLGGLWLSVLEATGQPVRFEMSWDPETAHHGPRSTAIGSPRCSPARGTGGPGESAGQD